ncbi:hypothetical protein ABT340_38530, partial [Streptosporangium sp. NPDC000239]|uniref:hypothetical protein n=1 Tax=Streptosporangium sp. NPDC000239 TaxID=3154248 RepID=UPI00332505CB
LRDKKEAARRTAQPKTEDHEHQADRPPEHGERDIGLRVEAARRSRAVHRSGRADGPSSR